MTLKSQKVVMEMQQRLSQGLSVFYAHPRRGNLRLTRLYWVAGLNNTGHCKLVAQDDTGQCFWAAGSRLTTEP